MTSSTERRRTGRRRWCVAILGVVLAAACARDQAPLGAGPAEAALAAGLAVSHLDPQPGERILDLCAAPGTKTAAIAERLAGRGQVLALDRHERRLGLVGRGLRRLELGGVAVAERDATKSLADLLEHGGPFDRILVDAPCSGLGALRRNPDARWRVRPEDLPELAKVQRALLESAATLLKPGGVLV